MKIINSSEAKKNEIVSEIVEVLNSGGLVIYPTETCYGVGADATNQVAVDKLLRFKQRLQGKAISVAVSDIEMAGKYVTVNSEAEKIYKQFLPGPITVISNAKTNSPLANGLVSEHDTLGIRIPDFPLVLDIVKKTGKPITATSANIASLPSPYSLEQWQRQTSKSSQQLIDLFVDVGNLPPRSPSTVIDTTKDSMLIVRLGEISPEASDWQAITKSEDETQKIAFELMMNQKNEILEKSLVFALLGDMGSGKTQFAKGIAKALGIKETIQSPTFTILNEYQYDKGFFVHIDTWRLENKEETENLGIENYFLPNAVLVIEWADRIIDYLDRCSDEKRIILIKVVIDSRTDMERCIFVKQ